MPIREYACRTCGEKIERLQRLNEDPLTDCPNCGEAALEKKISAVGFRLAGGGWYETDFKSDQRRNISGDNDSSSTGTEAQSAGNGQSSGNGDGNGAAQAGGGEQSSQGNGAASKDRAGDKKGAKESGGGKGESAGAKAGSESQTGSTAKST